MKCWTRGEKLLQVCPADDTKLQDLKKRCLVKGFFPDQAYSRLVSLWNNRQRKGQRTLFFFFILYLVVQWRTIVFFSGSVCALTRHVNGVILPDMMRIILFYELWVDLFFRLISSLLLEHHPAPFYHLLGHDTRICDTEKCSLSVMLVIWHHYKCREGERTGVMVMHRLCRCFLSFYLCCVKLRSD